ncbi:MAG: hypothetical protein HJJLKODD_02975 [Phycisphaerae bacterium]|nr:hypothetical protein [Phycisphaerae bacterium]
MGLFLGIDVGSVSVKGAAVASPEWADTLEQFTKTSRLLQPLAARPSSQRCLFVTLPVRTKGQPLLAAKQLLDGLLRCLPVEQVQGMTITGTGAELVAEAVGGRRCNEFQALAWAVNELHPDVRSIFELGGENSRYLALQPDPASGQLSIIDYSNNGDCAAGTGSFLDQQANRLKYAVEEIGPLVAKTTRTAQIAGRCSVFAKSDMIHAQQKGFTPAEVLAGLCHAVAVNFKSAVIKGRRPARPIAVVGGVAANSAVIAALRDVFEIDATSNELLVPQAAESLGAIGAALIAAGEQQPSTPQLQLRLAKLQTSPQRPSPQFTTALPLTLERVQRLNQQIKPYTLPRDGRVLEAYLGLDIGSVGTKAVVIDQHGEVIHSIFTRTEGRPIEVVARVLRELNGAVGEFILIRGVGTTGSGRELIGELVGADSINDEITAHKTGAIFVGERMLGRRPDTIFEIGGQDSKYISLQPAGVTSREMIVTDFTMNEACAAGTGSFLEERAAELGVAIKDEFARLALASTAPLKLGERCTVFMERDVNTYMQRGAKREDVLAGLAYSVAYNYINRVVRGRPIGECIFFQGGTAYNNAVAAAFSRICDREIIIPPHNAVLGAIGAALLAQEKMSATQQPTRFRGYDLSQIDYQVREFTCNGCGNYCQVQEFTVENEKTFWGDKCSEKFRKPVKSPHPPVIPDLIALRRELLLADDTGDPPQPRGSIGIPMAMYTHEYLPLWRRFFRDCGFRVVISTGTSRQTIRAGLGAVVAEPCFPIIVAHGHVAELVEQGLDYIWLPNMLSAETTDPDNESHFCPWGQTLPFVLRQAPPFRKYRGRFLCPAIRFRQGLEQPQKELIRLAAGLGVPRKVADKAYTAGVAAQLRFRTSYLQAGCSALATLETTGEPGIVLVGRPYNIHDAGVNLSVTKKLREQYGLNILPVDALPTSDIDIRDINSNMYWELGRRILAAAKIVARHPHLHVVYITNFKCGPDSYIKGYLRPAAGGKPFLTLQIDGHSNDAGLITRCEAYLDSKGILRWWRKSASDVAVSVWPDESSTSPKWPTPVPA